MSTAENEECSICLTNIINVGKLNCKHVFCHECINHWYTINKLCPMCKQLITHINDVQMNNQNDFFAFNNNNNNNNNNNISIRINTIGNICGRTYDMPKNIIVPIFSVSPWLNPDIEHNNINLSEDINIGTGKSMSYISMMESLKE